MLKKIRRALSGELAMSERRPHLLQILATEITPEALCAVARQPLDGRLAIARMASGIKQFDDAASDAGIASRRGSA